MAGSSLRRAARRLRARVVYRIDTLLTFPPIGQVVTLFFVTVVLVVVWALLLRLAAPHAAESVSDREAVWWSLTHFMDGGTMATDVLGHRLVALGATASGVLVLSLLTAAFASKMNERIQDLRSGLNPVIERDHILVLGYAPDVVLMSREIARSGQWRTLVVLSQTDKVRVETGLRNATRLVGSRLRVVVRTGDPRSEAALLRVSAEHASSIVVVPPPDLHDDESVQWTLSTLLAVRRVVEDEFVGQIIVEARHAENREVLLLAAEPGVAGPRALSTDIVASDDIIARVLAQSVRQEGVYFALREMLAFNRREIYLDELPQALQGVSFAEAHERLTGGILLGVQRPIEGALLAPRLDREIVLADGDRLIVLSSGRGRYRLDGKLPDAPIADTDATPPVAKPETVVILGFNRTLPLLARELDDVLPAHSVIRVACGGTTPEIDSIIDGATRRVVRSTLQRDPRTPCDLMREGGDEVYTADAVIILACEQSESDNGDADALANLLWLRHGMRRTGRTVRRTITEVHDPRSALHVPEMAHDFSVSSSVVAMLLAQAAVDPEVARIYREILSPDGAEIYLRHRWQYIGRGPRTFADVMAAARARGEIALGFFPPEDASDEDVQLRRERLERSEVVSGRGDALQLNPPRDTPVPDDERVGIIVLALP
jgi:hypothetical protein